MTEQPFFFPSGGHNLYGVLHSPAAVSPAVGMVFCAPMFEEKLWAHRVLVNFARELVGRGVPVLRFDYMGHGDSEGAFERADIETRLLNIRDAMNQLRSRSGCAEAGLLGLRFGATLATLAAESEPSVPGPLVMWEPLPRGTAYMQEMFRINLATQMASYKEIRVNRSAMVESLLAGGLVNVDGYGITGSLYEQASSIDLLGDQPVFKGRTLVVGIQRGPGPAGKSLQQLMSRYPAGQLEAVQEQPFWKEIKPYVAASPVLFEKTADWLVEGKA